MFLTETECFAPPSDLMISVTNKQDRTLLEIGEFI